MYQLLLKLLRNEWATYRIYVVYEKPNTDNEYVKEAIRKARERVEQWQGY